MTNGRTKGNGAEREVAGLCQAWWRQIEPECKFVRTPMSGGWSTPQIRAEFRAAADLMTTARRWPFAVEVKRRESFSWIRVLQGKASPVWAWWTQTVRAADELKAKPMLWLRHNNEPWQVIVGYGAIPLTSVMPRFQTRLVPDTGLLLMVPAAALLAIPPETLLR